jgi:hypothetical protein
VGLTPEAQSALRGSETSLNDLPFHVRRDRRDPERTSFRFLRNRRRKGTDGADGLYLPDQGSRHRLSREHFLIGRDGEQFYLEDLRRSCGTLVEGQLIGGSRCGGRCRLRSGDVIIPGASHSPYVFKFVGPAGRRLA